MVVCQLTCYPSLGSHYDCTRSPLHEQGQTASPEKKMKKTLKQTRTQKWTREQAREKSHYHAMWKWSGKDSEVTDRMAAESVRNASDPVAERAVEESSAEERSAVVAVAHGHGHVRSRAHVYYSREYSYVVNQVRAAEGFEDAGDRVGEAQGTTTREFAGVIRIQMQRAMVVRVVRTMTMTMYFEIEVFHCSYCCPGGWRRQSGSGGVSLSGIGSGQRREAKRHLILGPADAKAERDD